MGEMIDFASRKKVQVAQPAPLPSPAPSVEEATDKPKSYKGLEVPSRDALYDSTRLTYHGTPVTEFEQAMEYIGNAHPDRIDQARTNMETDLLTARVDYIDHEVPEAQREAAARELIAYTKAKAAEINSDTLRQIARGTESELFQIAPAETPTEQTLYYGVAIPSAGALYDDALLIHRGHPIREFMQHAEGMSPQEREATLLKLEERLLSARISYIAHEIGIGPEQEVAYRDLIDHTWGRAEEIGSAQLKSDVTRIVTDRYDTGRAGKILARLDMVNRISGQQGATPVEAPPPAKKANPFRIIK